MGPAGPMAPAGPAAPVGPTGPVAPVAPEGIVKSSTAADELPLLPTLADEPGAPVSVLPTEIVAAAPGGPADPPLRSVMSSVAGMPTFSLLSNATDTGPAAFRSSP